VKPATKPTLLAAAFFAAALLAGTSACGGGTEEPECPTDDCSIPGNTVVKWRFHEYPEWGFLADTCLDLGVTTVHVEAVNQVDPSLYFAVDKGCGDGQASFLRLPEGMYDVVVTPLDAAGNPMVSVGSRGAVMAGLPTAPTETVVNVPYTAWTGTFTGTFLFQLTWAGQGCTAAAVATQTLELKIKGQPSDKLADNGQKLDGTDDKPCRSDNFAQFAEGLPMGPVTFKVTGKDAGGLMKFEREIETFVGAGKNNPTINVDVLAPTM
jgi:cyclic lactone autoinducer peptide